MKIEFNFAQAGVIPYRRVNNAIEILLITSRRKQKWIIPKGYIEFNLTSFESAKKEAYEEAGVIGSNETYELGEIIFDKPIGKCLMKIYSMEVVKFLDDYPESNFRKRKWFPIDEAIQKIEMEGVADLMQKIKKSIN